MKLATKLMIQCGVFGALPIVVGAIVARQLEGELVSSIGDGYMDLADSAGDKIDRLLEDRYGGTLSLANLPSLVDRSAWYKLDETASPLVRLMNANAAAFDQFYMMTFLDLEGRVAGVNTRDSEGHPIGTAAIAARSFRDASWFRAVEAERYTTESKYAAKEHHGMSGVVVELLRDSADLRAAFPSSDGRAVVFAAPAKKDGKIIGYWASWLKMSAIDEILHEVAVDVAVEGAEVVLVDADGRIAASIGTSGEKSMGPGAEELVAGKTTSAILTDASGKEFAVGVQALDGSNDFPGLGWAILVRAPVELAAAKAIAHANRALAVQLGLFALVLVAAVVLARRMAKPVAAMAEVADRIAKGDVDQEVAHEGRDEVGQLADSFRAMIVYIRGVTHAAKAMEKGDLGVEVTPQSDRDVLSQSMVEVCGAVKLLVGEVSGLAATAAAGKLDDRLEVTRFDGSYRELAAAVNQMLDAMLAPVQEAMTVLERMASRDLTASMVGDYRGDHERLKNAVNVAVVNVRSSLLHVARSAEQVKSAASQLASGSQGLASGASEQAAALAETRSTLEGVGSMTEQNAASAEKATTLAASAHDLSGAGADAMQRLNEAVAHIRTAVTGTAEIIRDINQIAFQTNLLALNAAVEAARAGDAGRGFAVVADEVRNLAQQAKTAAHKTEELLRGAIGQAEQGSAISAEVSRGLASIVDAVQEVDAVIQEIAAASREQAAGVSQVSQATEQMDQVTHQNAASSEELSSTAEELSAQAHELAGLVGQFRLGDDAKDGRTSATPTSVRPGTVAMPAQHVFAIDDHVELRDF